MERELNYKCSADETHAPWSGYAGKVPTQCPVCEADGIITGEQNGNAVVDANPGAGAPVETTEDAPTGETAEAEFAAGGAGANVDVVDVANYRITGLVDFSDEQGNIRGQFPIGSVQELPTFVGDPAVADGRAERVE